MKYSCCFINSVTGDQRTVVVELDNDEIADARKNLGIDGPVARSYVMRRGSRCVPAGFDPDLASITRVRLN
jgi:hypothetical protein